MYVLANRNHILLLCYMCKQTTKEFKDSSFKTRNRRVLNPVQSRMLEELMTVAQSTGHRNIAKVIAVKMERLEKVNDLQLVSSAVTSIELTCDEALAYYVHSTSSHSYNQTREQSIKTGNHVFPSYYSVAKSTNFHYPPEVHVMMTETPAEITLQTIMHNIVECLIQVHLKVNTNFNSSLTIVIKWEYDGSSVHITYKQKLVGSTETTDQCLFVFPFVPIKLYDEDNVISKNFQSSPKMFCHRINFILFLAYFIFLSKNHTNAVHFLLNRSNNA